MATNTVAELRSTAPVPKAQPQIAKKNVISPGISLTAGAVAGAVEATVTVCSILSPVFSLVLLNVDSYHSTPLSLLKPEFN